MKVYLDNCCFNRPFDDQSKIRIKLEAEAKLYIQEKIRQGVVELVWSYILDYENSMNPFEERRRSISEWRREAVVDVEETSEVLDRSNILCKAGMKSKDALHISCAIHAHCEYFLTTDDVILKKAKSIRELKIVDPSTFIREVNL
jgi:predicted nucleic acid-binding protein